VALLQQRQKEIEMRRGRMAHEKGIFDGAEVILDSKVFEGIQNDSVELSDEALEKIRR
jgi:hypothetical protein